LPPPWPNSDPERGRAFSSHRCKNSAALTIGACTKTRSATSSRTRPTFARAPALLSVEAPGTIVELVPADPGTRWLEVACGPAAIGRTLATRVGAVHGVDLTPATIGKAREEAAREGLADAEFSLGDATALEFEDAEGWRDRSSGGPRRLR
jgi:2-polyprenyl-3-methyl-5-hydroxy-6-metoxy-1,4-benzoquinol methylase